MSFQKKTSERLCLAHTTGVQILHKVGNVAGTICQRVHAKLSDTDSGHVHILHTLGQSQHHSIPVANPDGAIEGCVGHVDGSSMNLLLFRIFKNQKLILNVCCIILNNDLNFFAHVCQHQRECLKYLTEQ